MKYEYSFTVTSHVSTYQKIDCLFNSIFEANMLFNILLEILLATKL